MGNLGEPGVGDVAQPEMPGAEGVQWPADFPAGDDALRRSLLNFDEMQLLEKELERERYWRRLPCTSNALGA